MCTSTLCTHTQYAKVPQIIHRPDTLFISGIKPMHKANTEILYCLITFIKIRDGLAGAGIPYILQSGVIRQGRKNLYFL